jgi:chaperonin GroEL
MKNQFSLLKNITKNSKALYKIDQCIKISIGPTGKNGIVANKNKTLKFLTSGSSLLKSLEFSDFSSNILLKLLEQAATKTKLLSGDGSTTTILITCELLDISLRYLSFGYNSILLSSGLKKVSYFIIEKILEFSVPVKTISQLSGILKTALGKRINSDLFLLLKNSLTEIGRDGLLLVEENISDENEIEIVQGIEIEKGFASSYFINDLKNFQVIYENPYLLIANKPINSMNQISKIIEYSNLNNRPLVIIVEEINKDILSSLVLNNIKKQVKIVVIKYTSIKFMKAGLLEDLAILTHSKYFDSKLDLSGPIFEISDLGQVKKVIINKDKSTFFVSKFAKLIAARRINELSRELLNSESEYEKNIFKTRIARLSGNIAKIKLGITNQYQIDELKQKIENGIFALKAALEEGCLPGGGIFYFALRSEVVNWATLNLVGEELFASYIIIDALQKPFIELMSNNNLPFPLIFSQLQKQGYPYAYDLLDKKIVNSFEVGLLDSSKSIRASLWNSISIVSTLITIE